MRLCIAAFLAVSIWPAAAAAASVAPLAGEPAAPAERPAEGLRLAMQQQTLPPGGKLAEHRPEGERYVFVVSGQLKVSNLVTGDEQVVGAGKMAAEQPGDWHTAEAIGTEPATFYLIDRAPAASAAMAHGN